MRYYILIFVFFFFQTVFSQGFKPSNTLDLANRISTIDFVEILDHNDDEVFYYYQNNWMLLRKKAQDKNYILSYQMLKTPPTSDSNFQIILITTYANKKLYDKREEHFSELINSNKNGLKLLNDKKPTEFRKVVFNKELVKHLN